jgi:tRNA/rRNA methyltransferase
MGFSDLRLVDPVPFRTRSGFDMAVHARDVLDRARTYPDLASALEGCSLSVGTTCRSGPYRSRADSLREAAAKIMAESASNRIAVVFGPEDFGLTNEDLKLCQLLITIATGSEYPSLNVAQAMIVVAYELLCASQAPASRTAHQSPARAPVAEIDSALERLKEALIAIGFLPGENPDHIMFALREIVGRAGTNPRELDILNGIASQISWFAGGGFATVERKLKAGKKIR